MHKMYVRDLLLIKFVLSFNYARKQWFVEMRFLKLLVTIDSLFS